MLDNSITLTSDNNGVTVAISDLSQPGRVIRKNADGTRLIIASQQTRENVGYVTERTVVRKETPLSGLSNTAKPNGVAIVQITFSVPKDPNVDAVAVIGTGLAQLTNLLKPEGAAVSGADYSVISRLLAGEH